jgi:hypothetical protein
MAKTEINCDFKEKNFECRVKKDDKVVETIVADNFNKIAERVSKIKLD